MASNIASNPSPVQAVSVGGHSHFALYAVLAVVTLLTLIVIYILSASSHHLRESTG